MAGTIVESVASTALERSDPPGVARGTVLVLPGRGDDASYYRRLSGRLAVDGYATRIATSTVASAHDVAQLWAADADARGVHVLVGVDTSAGFVAEALAESLVWPAPAGAVFAGTAVDGGATPDAATELAARSACPVHRGVVENADAASLADSVVKPVWPDRAAGIPVLAVHGEADPISPVATAVALFEGWNADVVTVAGGLHDVLNDVHHRSVAAEIVAFLERLRADDAGAPILRRVRTR